MVSRGFLFVFIVPVVASLAFGGAVMYGLAEQAGPAAHTGSAPEPAAAPAGLTLSLTGLQAEYNESEKVEAGIVASDPGIGCSFLYIELARDGGAPAQSTFPDTCLDDDGLFESGFSESLDPGTYEIEAWMLGGDGKKVSVTETFTVK